MIFVGESNLERKINGTYMAYPFAQHYFTKLLVKIKIRGITLNDGLIKWKWFQLYVPIGKLHIRII
jgi:hypothetical protein